MTQTVSGTASQDLPSEPMTFEAFLDWLDANPRAEWVDGQVILMSPTEDTHQFLLMWLVKILDEFVLAHSLGILLCAPFLMRLPTRPAGREPDILFLANANSARNKKTYIDGPADLVVEIVSPESETRDRTEKLGEYERGGVREYWLLDPRRKQAAFYQLGEDNLYHASAIEDGIYRSAALEGLWLKVDWLWQEPRPSLPSVLKAWNLL